MKVSKQFRYALVVSLAVLFLWIGSAIALQPGAQASTPGAGYTPKAQAMDAQLEDNTINKDLDTPGEIRRGSARLANQAERRSDNLIENAQEKLGNAADTVREKLNLDQPLTPETKRFAKDVQENVESTAESVKRSATSR